MKVTSVKYYYYRQHVSATFCINDSIVNSNVILADSWKRPTVYR